VTGVTAWPEQASQEYSLLAYSVPAVGPISDHPPASRYLSIFVLQQAGLSSAYHPRGCHRDPLPGASCQQKVCCHGLPVLQGTVPRNARIGIPSKRRRQQQKPNTTDPPASTRAASVCNLLEAIICWPPNVSPYSLPQSEYHKRPHSTPAHHHRADPHSSYSVSESHYGASASYPVSKFVLYSLYHGSCRCIFIAGCSLP
jgi:hypothetical protein